MKDNMKTDRVDRSVWDRDARETLRRRPLVHTEILDQIVARRPSRGLVLEIGAQRGVDAAALVDLGYRVVALDYSDESIAMMRSRYRGKLLIVKGDARHLPFRDRRFSLVYSQGLLEHYFEPDLGRIMLEQRRVIRDDGLVLVDVPNLFSPLTIPKHILMALKLYVLPQEWQYSWRALRRLGQRYGLAYVHHYTWGYDRLVARPIIRVLESLPFGLGRVTERMHKWAEKEFGDYLLKCVGVFFRKV